MLKIHTQSIFEHWPFADNSIQAIITSPPYYSLRKYSIPDVIIGGDIGGDKVCKHEFELNDMELNSENRQGKGSNTLNASAESHIACHAKKVGKQGFCVHCNAWKGQHGLEPTFALYLAHCKLWMQEAIRVLRDDGVIFINLADSYASSGGASRHTGYNDPKYPNGRNGEFDEPTAYPQGNVKPKSKLLIPERFAIMCVDELGLICRNHIVWCLSGGTWVYTKAQKGEMPMMIRDVARLRPNTVKLWNGEKWTQVLGWSKSKRKGTEIEFVLRSGERISCTPNHKFPTDRGLLEAINLKKGDILQRVLLPSPEKTLSPCYVPSMIGWFIGLYVAEGSRSADCIQISGHIKEEKRFALLKDIVEKYGGIIQRYDVKGNAQIINIHSKILNAILNEYVSGKTARDKSLSIKCWRRDNRFLGEILNGYLSGDGHWDIKNNRWRLGFTRNYNLERDLRVLCARLGYKLILNIGVAKIKDRKFPCFRGEIRTKQNNHHNCKNPNEVVEIRKARCREVYDIGVADEPHLFALASGILTHNSKPNAMPEPCQDRFSKKWESIFMLTKQPKYYFNLADVREKAPPLNRWGGNKLIAKGKSLWDEGTGHSTYRDRDMQPNDGMKNPGDCWSIPTQPSPEKHFACVTPDTEILTIEGWKKYTDIKKYEYPNNRSWKYQHILVATYNLKKQIIEYQPLAYLREYDFNGELIHVGNSSLDILMTPNHRNIIKKATGEETVVLAEKLAYMDKIRVSAPMLYPENNGIGVTLAELIGFIISEGHYKKGGYIEIYQQEGKIQTARIDYLLNKLEIPYTKHSKIRMNRNKKLVTWFLKKSPLVEWVIQNVPPKKLTQYLVSLPIKEAKALFNGLMAGDGHVRKDDGRSSFSQKDKETQGWFQILALRLGYHSIASSGINIFLTHKQFIGIRNTNGKGMAIKKIPYQGKVWCPKTFNGTWIARRNGRIFITGNTWPEFLAQRMILCSTKAGDTVLDCFAGSGTTLRVADELNRVGIGIELGYKELLERRLTNIQKELPL